MPRPKRDLVRSNFYLQTNVVQGLKKLAERRKTHVSDIVRAALKQYVVDELRKETENDNALSAATSTESSEPKRTEPRAPGDG